MSDWKIFTGKPDAPPHGLEGRPPPPPWRDFGNEEVQLADRRGRTYRASPEEIEMVNAALYLRRPLLVTGPPGAGKSSLAYAVAQELQLGRVLLWPINSRSTLADGLYHYDALGRLRDVQQSERDERAGALADIGRYLRLGPLGTAMATSTEEKPSVLIVDEIDKSDIDLANDLLHVFEDGVFEIPELLRIADQVKVVDVLPSDRGVRVPITGGRVACPAFPFVVLTSNGERELPPAFLRRCLRLDISTPKEERLREILKAHLGPEALGKAEFLLQRFIKDWQEGKVVATDQLLNAVFLVTKGRAPAGAEGEALVARVLRDLSER